MSQGTTAAPAIAEEHDLTASRWATVITFLVVGFNSVGNLAFHAVVARRDGTAGYGAVAALLSFGTVSGVVASGVQYAVARRLAQPGTRARTELLRGGRALGPWIALSVVLAAAGAPLASYLHLTQSDAVVFAVAYFASNIVQAVPLGVLIGLRRFGTWAVSVATAVVVRLAIVVFMGASGSSQVGAVVSSAVGSTISALLAITLIWALSSRHDQPLLRRLTDFLRVIDRLGKNAPRDELAPTTSGIEQNYRDGARDGGAVPGEKARTGLGVESGSRRLAWEGIGGALLGAGLWVVWVLPIVFGRHYLSPGEAGKFGSAQLLATGIIYLVGAVTTAFFPSVARYRTRHSVAAGSMLALAVTVGCVLVFVAAGPFVVHLVYGPSFVEPFRLLAVLGASVGVVAMATFFLWLSRAVRHLTLVPAVGIAMAVFVECCLGVAWHGSVMSLAAGPAVAFCIGALSSALAWFVLRVGEGRPPAFSRLQPELAGEHLATGSVVADVPEANGAHRSSSSPGSTVGPRHAVPAATDQARFELPHE